MKSISTYIVLALVIGIFVYLISGFASNIRDSEHSDLSVSSEVYIAQITGEDRKVGFNTSIYDEELESATEIGGTDNKNEFSLDFNYGRNSASKIKRFAYIATNLPSYLVVDLFRLTPLVWLGDLLDWFARIMLFVALYIFIRKGDG